MDMRFQDRTAIITGAAVTLINFFWNVGQGV